MCAQHLCSTWVLGVVTQHFLALRLVHSPKVSLGFGGTWPFHACGVGEEPDRGVADKAVRKPWATLFVTIAGYVLDSDDDRNIVSCP
jgi:hypothetical protein